MIKIFDIMSDSVEERIKRKFIVENECWIWLGPFRDHIGYRPIISITIESFTRVNVYVSRYQLTKKLGRDIKEGYEALHTCNNGKCINPDHLYEGTVSDNSRDTIAAGNHNLAFHRPKSAFFTDEQVIAIREEAKNFRKFAHPGRAASLARKYGTDRATMVRLLNRKTYANIGVK